MRRLRITLVAAAALAAPLEAGIEYKARSWQEGQQATEQAEMTVWARVDGDNARVEFQESGNPWMTQGSYLLTTDGGETVYLVNPEEKTYSEFDLTQVMQLFGAFSESGLIDFEIENPKLETLESGSGKTVAGLSTQHARYRTSYDMQLKVMGFKQMQRVETYQDVWYTTEVDDRGMSVWLKKEPPRTGTDLDQLIDLELSKIKGFPLETVETTITTNKKGKQSTTTTHMQVSELDRSASFAAAVFDLPSDYTPVQMVPPEAMMAAGRQGEGEEPQEEEKGGLMGRLKKLRKN